eukprot:COSAG01_NODE_9377_length_2463_cov_18.677242_4_plen_32_part_01
MDAAKFEGLIEVSLDWARLKQLLMSMEQRLSG